MIILALLLYAAQWLTLAPRLLWLYLTNTNPLNTMEKFNNPPVIWFIVGFLFFLLEFVVPGLILFFFAVGAWIVALLSLFIDLSINTQLLLFVFSSVLTILLFRKWVKKIVWSKRYNSEIEDEFIGKIAKAETFISTGQPGKVNFKGTSWTARSEDNIAPGETVTIIGNDSIVLIVKSTIP
jgi:inner membrane protein